MGYVIKGEVAFRSGDGEELFEAGDAYYVGPGHPPVLYAGTEVIEFSPTEELGRTMEVVTRTWRRWRPGRLDGCPGAPSGHAVDVLPAPR